MNWGELTMTPLVLLSPKLLWQATGWSKYLRPADSPFIRGMLKRWGLGFVTQISGNFHSSATWLPEERGPRPAPALPEESRRALPPTRFQSLTALPNFDSLGFDASCRVFSLHRRSSLSSLVWSLSEALVEMILLLLKTRLGKTQSVWVLKWKSV